jgi:hypothetical protein
MAFTPIIGAATGALDVVGRILDNLFTTDEEKLTKQEALLRLAQEPQLAQIELNKIEAGHRSIFVAGWRPFIGWVCGFGLAWHYILYDMFIWVQVNFFPHTAVVPQLTGTESLISIVMALLGLGAYRTIEKIKGISK